MNKEDPFYNQIEIATATYKIDQFDIFQKIPSIRKLDNKFSDYYLNVQAAKTYLLAWILTHLTWFTYDDISRVLNISIAFISRFKDDINFNRIKECG